MSAEEAMIQAIRAYLEGEGWDLSYLGPIQIFEVIGNRQATHEITFEMLAVRDDDE